MQREKAKWVEEVLKSADTMRSTYRPDMSGKILSRINRGQNTSIGMADTGMIWRIAASVVLLLAFNSLTIYGYQSRMSEMRRGPSMDAASVFGFSQSSNDPGSVIFGN